MYDIIIVGMGISGITAAIYAKRSNLNVLLIDKSAPGGMLNKIDSISNYPGLPNISGPDFAINLLNQLNDLEIPYKIEEVISLKLKGPKKIVKTTNNEYTTKNIILALGRTPKFLGLKNEQELLGHGVSTCAMCDAFFYRNKEVAVVGTGNSALQESLFLTKVVSKVYLINRRDGFRGDAYLVNQVKNNPKIEIIYKANIASLNSEAGKLDSITLDNGDTINIAGVFIYIGYTPDTKIVDSKLLNENGYIKVNKKLATSIKGVYAIGDCLNKDIYQLITAASDGAIVINNIEKTK